MNEKIKFDMNTYQERARKVENSMDPLERKRTGSYYTSPELSTAMMQELVNNILSCNKPIEEYKFLEPCVGTGSFVFSYLHTIHKMGIESKTVKSILENIYVADINTTALLEYKNTLTELVFSYWHIKLDESYFKSHIGSGLLIDVTSEEPSYIPISNVFSKQVVGDGFDIVVTNPPYKKLKAEIAHYNNEIEYEIDKAKYNNISKIAKKHFKYSSEGVLNLYKLFVEEIIEKYAAKDAYINLLIPASILSDKTSTKIRTHILKDMKLLSVKVISEGSGYIDAQQALSTLLIHKGEATSAIDLIPDYCKKPNEITRIEIDDILNDNTGNSIFAIDKDDYEIIKRLREFPVIKDLCFIHNLRGELDLTTNKEYITSDYTEYRLLRGRNIDYYGLIDEGSLENVNPEFISNTNKNRFIKNDRIVCQQIANMKKVRRIKFALVHKNYVLGNSCNFISVDENKYGIDIYSMLGILNSKLINWYFKLTSTNNHINNYEIDSFPIPVASKFLRDISTKVKRYLETNEPYLIDEIELLVKKSYGLVKDDISVRSHKKAIIESFFGDASKLNCNLTLQDAEQILKGKKTIMNYADSLTSFDSLVLKGLTDKYIRIYNNQILNHTTFKLSELDLEMIKSVPQGGSWKDIPQETVNKSKRLKRISETGGRTTLYGRIDYNKPSYTITTYFNRPGNGTYVHPTHERVLSVREAARFQTFKDDYYFYGNKTQMLKQVGNAVPTILAYQIGKEIVKKTGYFRSIDLFCGAGGMTAGFKAAGIKSLLSNDIDESACVSLKINNPEIPVLCGDITIETTKRTICDAAKNGDAEILCGGPPCQGFSMAGYRSDSDPRNQLFRDFVNIVKRIKPKIIVFENVEGLLSFQGGNTYRELHSLFSELGYRTEGRTLMANHYGVPQKRKRVIVICTLNELYINPSELFPKPITLDDSIQVTSKETIFDLEPIECNDSATYSNSYCSDIIRFFKGKQTYEQYVESCYNRNNNFK